MREQWRLKPIHIVWLALAVGLVLTFQNCGAPEHVDRASSNVSFLKATCSQEYVPEYHPSLLTRTELLYVIKDTLSFSAPVQKKISQLPDISVDRLSDETIYAENNSATVPSELYLATLLDLSDILFGEYEATPVFKNNCAASSNPASCLDFLIGQVVVRLWRRPLIPIEINTLEALFKENLPLRTKANALFTMTLTSPQFYLKNYLPSVKKGPIVNYDQYYLASRISFFLYNSVPDAELWAAAVHGQLATASQIESQVDRILKNPGFANRFTLFTLAPWAGLDWDIQSSAVITNDKGVSVPLSTLAQQPFQQLYNMVLENAPLSDFVYGPSVMMSAPIAGFLGLSTTGLGSTLTRVPATETMIGSYFTSPHFAQRTKSPVGSKTLVSKRGIMVAEKFLCTNIPPNELSPSDIIKVLKGATNEIQVGERRSTHPSCVSCHGVVDKMGMGLEFMDVFGKLRTTYADQTPIAIHFKVHPSDSEYAMDIGSFLSNLSHDERFHSCFLKTIANKVAPMTLSAPQGCVNEVFFQHSGGGIRDYVKGLVSSRVFTLTRRSE